MPMISKDLLPESARDVQPGDRLVMTVSKVDDGGVELDYDSVEVKEAESKNEAPVTEEQARSMPLSRLEKRLPKADREEA